MSSFPLESRNTDDPTLMAAHRRQRAASIAAVSAQTDDWPEADRAIAAAMLDVLWSVASYERLVVDWDLDPKEAIKGATWVIGLVEDAIHGSDPWDWRTDERTRLRRDRLLPPPKTSTRIRTRTTSTSARTDRYGASRTGASSW